jgi:NAD(P)-dependent dehydrogenase (short-subunit alcohol dehydrogenase family)
MCAFFCDLVQTEGMLGRVKLSSALQMLLRCRAHHSATAGAPLAGHTALVSGSTSGIGLGIATVLAGKGANVVLHGFGDPEPALAAVRAASAAIPGHHGKFKYIAADFTDAADIQKLAAEASSTFGVVDIVVNNAGIQHVSSVKDFELDMWEKVLQVNLTSAYVLTRALLPGMLRSNFGRVVNIASGAFVSFVPLTVPPTCYAVGFLVLYRRTLQCMALLVP